MGITLTILRPYFFASLLATFGVTRRIILPTLLAVSRLAISVIRLKTKRDSGLVGLAAVDELKLVRVSVRIRSKVINDFSTRSIFIIGVEQINPRTLKSAYSGKTSCNFFGLKLCWMAYSLIIQQNLFRLGR